jgi:hypothetical protein
MARIVISGWVHSNQSLQTCLPNRRVHNYVILHLESPETTTGTLLLIKLKGLFGLEGFYFIFYYFVIKVLFLF